MAWHIVLGDESFSIDKLSPDDLMGITNARTPDGFPKYPYLDWLTLRNHPAGDPNAFYDLVCVVARQLKLPTPDRPADVGEMVHFVVGHVKRVDDDDLPTAFRDDALPLENPETEDPKTSTSGTSTEPEDGTQT